MDNRPNNSMLTDMTQQEPRLFGRRTIGIVLALTLVVFLLFTSILGSNVPSDHAPTIWIVSAFTSVCLSGVFFLAAFMFSAVLNDQRNRRQD